jgi:hypothetical protein
MYARGEEGVMTLEREWWGEDGGRTERTGTRVKITQEEEVRPATIPPTRDGLGLYSIPNLCYAGDETAN